MGVRKHKKRVQTNSEKKSRRNLQNLIVRILRKMGLYMKSQNSLSRTHGGLQESVESVWSLENLMGEQQQSTYSSFNSSNNNNTFNLMPSNNNLYMGGTATTQQFIQDARVDTSTQSRRTEEENRRKEDEERRKREEAEKQKEEER